MLRGNPQRGRQALHFLERLNYVVDIVSVSEQRVVAEPHAIAADTFRDRQGEARIALRAVPIPAAGKGSAFRRKHRIAIERMGAGSLQRDALGLACSEADVSRQTAETFGVVPES